MKPPPITLAELRERYAVEDDGTLIRLRKSRMPAGSAVGRIDADGYVTSRFNKRMYPVHRVVFALANGRWPNDQVDHINGIRHDNRPCNLREATRSQNQRNRRGVHKASTTGFKGVIWSAQHGRWLVRIRKVAGQKKHVGIFDHPGVAALIYAAAAARFYGEFACIEANT